MEIKMIDSHSMRIQNALTKPHYLVIVYNGSHSDESPLANEIASIKRTTDEKKQ